MKKLKLYSLNSLGALLALSIVLAPVVSFADNDNNQGGHGDSVKVEAHAGVTTNSSSSKSNNSWWNRLFGFFGTRVHAAQNKKPVISGITAPTVLKAGVEGTWTVKASDPANSSLSYAVDWGDASMQPLALMATPAFVQTSTFTHSYDNPGTYTVKFTVSNEANLTATSSVTVHVTGKKTSQAPVISNLSDSALKTTKATVTWNTDVNSTSMLWLSTTSPVDTSGNATVSKTGKVKNHKIKLTGLNPNTTYYVVVASADNGGTTKSSELSFTTPATADDTPVITSLDGDKTITTGDTANITVNAYDPKNDTLSYSVDWGDTAFVKAMSVSQPIFVQSATFEHEYDTAGTYTATFTVENSAGNKTSSSTDITVTDAADTTNPVISDIGVSAITSNSATISWTTDEASTTKVFFSTNTPVDTSSAPSASNSSLVTTHSIVITGLNANTTYHFIVNSADASANTAASTESSFTTTS